jgi:hypothetical protein
MHLSLELLHRCSPPPLLTWFPSQGPWLSVQQQEGQQLCLLHPFWDAEAENYLVASGVCPPLPELPCTPTSHLKTRRSAVLGQWPELPQQVPSAWPGPLLVLSSPAPPAGSRVIADTGPGCWDAFHTTWGGANLLVWDPEVPRGLCTPVWCIKLLGTVWQTQTHTMLMVILKNK